MQAILDTNFLLTCVRQKIDVFPQIKDLLPGARVIIPEAVIVELNRLGSSKDLKMSEREAAELSLQIIEQENTLILDLGDKADDCIVKFAKENEKVVVASLDRGIKARIKKLKVKGVKFLTIRAKKRLAFA